MSSQTVREIESAISTLTPTELDELFRWLDQHGPRPLEDRLQEGLAAGHFDSAIEQALQDEIHERVRPL